MFSQQMKLLVVFGFLGIASANQLPGFEEGMHKCPSCATGGFILKRWLMQHSEARQSMGWLDWRGTDCDAGTVYVVPCRGSCLTVTVEKQLSINEYLYQGTMQECSDQLIHSSPDLPKDIDFKNYHKDAVFVSKRMGHRITYKFERESFIDKHESNVQKIRKQSEQGAPQATLRDIVVMFCIFVSFCIFLAMCVVSIKICCYRLQARRNRILSAENVEMKRDVENNVPEQEPSTEQTTVEKEECKSEISSDSEDEDEEKNNNAVISV